MTEQDFLDKMMDILQRDEPISVDDDLSEIEEWDSLSSMATLVFFDKTLSAPLSIDKLRKVKTLKDLIILSEGKIK